jgi:rubrerythrin
MAKKGTSSRRGKTSKSAEKKPLLAKGMAMVKTAMNGVTGRVRSLKLGRVSVETFLDQLGQRSAVEETGVLIYDELLKRPDLSPDLAAKMRHIRDAEARHLRLVKDSIRTLGGDPDERTPSYKAAEIEASGLLDQVQKERIPLSHALHAVLTAELSDNAGWELLCIVARSAGHPAMATRFEQALLEEQEHLIVVRDALAKAVKLSTPRVHLEEPRAQ